MLKRSKCPKNVCFIIFNYKSNVVFLLYIQKYKKFIKPFSLVLTFILFLRVFKLLHYSFKIQKDFLVFIKNDND
jgi:hypothetical protein